MEIVNFQSSHRKKHFDFFRNMAQPHFNICAPIEISPLLKFLKEHKLPFTHSIVYLLSRVANEIPHFRQRIRGEQVVQHERVHPSFTVPTHDEEVFSFCEVPYTKHYKTFIKDARRISEHRYNQPVFEDDANRDDYLFLSAIPWISFSSIQHAMNIPTDSVPRISWGKYYHSSEETWMPLAVQAHHAVVDGKHTGLFFEKIQILVQNPQSTLQPEIK